MTKKKRFKFRNGALAFKNFQLEADGLGTCRTVVHAQDALLSDRSESDPLLKVYF